MIGEVGAGALISYFPSIWKNLQIASSDIRVALALPSAEYPAMCGVPIITFSNNSRLISGSCSHTSIIASEIEPLFNAFKRVPVSTTRNSNGNVRKKQSEYASQLKEKQKVKFIYGVLEKQFHNAYLKAEAMPGKTGENLLQLMERRLDNVVFRLGFAQTRRDARQLVSHAHFTVNGKKVNIPSYLIKAGDVIEVRESSRSSAKFAKLTGPEAPVVALPSWLDREAGTLKGVVNKLPERSDIDYEVAEHLIVELYSK